MPFFCQLEESLVKCKPVIARPQAVAIHGCVEVRAIAAHPHGLPRRCAPRSY